MNGKKTLAIGQSRRFDSYWTTALDYYAPDKRVAYSYDSDYDNIHGIFRNRPSWELHVKNTLSVPVTLTADGWMNDMNDILPGNANDSNHTGVIFTKNPVFGVSTNNFPATVQYQIIDNVIWVTIE